MSEKISQLIENDLYDADEIAIDGKPVFNFPGGEHDGYCAVNLRNAVICSKRRFNELTAEIEQLRKTLGDIFAAWVDDADPDECGPLIARVQPLLSTKDSPEMTAGERDILHTALRGSVRKVTEKD